MSEGFRIDLCDGKYTYILTTDYKQRVLRYGEEWRNLVGEGFILAMAIEFDEQRKKIATLRAALEPFAAMKIEEYEKSPDDCVMTAGAWGLPQRLVFALKDLRRARAVLDETE